MIHCGDALGVLRTLLDASVQCCITSPPYWGLRDYGTGSWTGGDVACDHLKAKGNVSRVATTLRRDGREHIGVYAGEKATETPHPYRDECGKCGAARVDEQIGLEETPALYVSKMVAVFAEVRRVLRDDGTLWLNLGDSYCSTDKWGGGKSGNTGKHTVSDNGEVPSWTVRARKAEIPGVKPKDLIGIPWRVALALQADGWWLRSDIIWHKPNPMPESVTDRPTRSHEYIFLLAKSEQYYYDYDAIKEKSAWPDGPNSPESIASPYGQGFTRANEPASFKGSKFNTGKTATHQLNCSSDKERVHGNLLGRSDGGAACNKPGQEYRNIRSVWTQATCPFPEAHFATFPPKLIEPCVIAGCPAGGTILDPFAGAGTTGLVAKKHGRQFIGIELNPAYVAMAEKRLAQEVLSFQ